MISKYYYLVSSLPYLRFQKEAIISTEDFVSECHKWLAAKEIDLLQGVDINNIQIDAKDPEIVREWKEFNKELKEDIARVRSAKKSLAHEKPTSAYPTGTVSRYREIFGESTPLLMEKRMEGIRWNFIEQKEPWCHFDINWLILYLLKLQILERLAVFNKEEGRKVFGQLCGVKNYG